MVFAAEDDLLFVVTYTSLHVLRPLFPSILYRGPGHRKRPYPFELSLKDDNNDMPRILYRLLLYP